MRDLKKELEETFKDPIFDTETITIGDIKITEWVNHNGAENPPRYWATCDGDIIAGDNDLFELLRKLYH